MSEVAGGYWSAQGHFIARFCGDHSSGATHDLGPGHQHEAYVQGYGRVPVIELGRGVKLAKVPGPQHPLVRVEPIGSRGAFRPISQLVNDRGITVIHLSPGVSLHISNRT
jgi:hypothetical protein